MEEYKAVNIQRLMLDCGSPPYFLPDNRREDPRKQVSYCPMLYRHSGQGLCHIYLVVVTCQPAHQLLVGRALCSSWAALGWFPLVGKGWLDQAIANGVITSTHPQMGRECLPVPS